MLSLCFYQLMGKIEEHKEKVYLVVDEYMVNKVLYSIKEIVGIEAIRMINCQTTLPLKIVKTNSKFYIQQF